MDYSFLKLYDSITDSISDDLFKTNQLQYYLMIQLSPTETYLQMTNYDGDLDLSNDFTCEVVDGCDNVLADITENVFTESYIDTEGLTQTKIEYVNLGVDYFGRAVHIRFSVNASNQKYYTRPIKITNKDILKTYRFDYYNPINMNGFSYESAGVYQSIRLWLKPKGLENKTEVSDYYQISTGNNISLRPLRQIATNFLTENIDDFIFVRLQEMLLHNIIYIDGKRITNKPILEYDDRIGESNLFRSNFTCNINDKDRFEDSFQIFDGLELTNFVPQGLYATGTNFTTISFDANLNLTLNSGTITIFNSSGTIQNTFTQADMSVSGNTLTIATDLNYTDDTYYVHISAGLVSAIGVDNEAINETITWTFTLRPSDYDVNDYNAVDYFTGISNPFNDNLVAFYKFNELVGTTMTDSEGSNDGTIVNAVINQTGLIDKAYSFNVGATDQYVTIPSSSDFNFGSGAFSIEIWVNPSNNFGRIFNKYNESTGDLQYRMFIQSGVLQFFMYTDASNRIGIADNVTIGTGSWQQIVVTYDADNGLKMKVDNVTASFAPIETGTYTGMPDTSQPIILGQQANDLSGANRYEGLTDIWRVWKGYALSDEEITTLYNSGNGTES